MFIDSIFGQPSNQTGCCELRILTLRSLQFLDLLFLLVALLPIQFELLLPGRIGRQFTAKPIFDEGPKAFNIDSWVELKWLSTGKSEARPLSTSKHALQLVSELILGVHAIQRLLE